MKTPAETSVSRFYNTIGWKTQNKITEDARRFEDLRDCAIKYVTKCRLRVQEYIPKKGDYLLDMGSGPIQFDEYLQYSRYFKKRYCLDLSFHALQQAKEKIKNHGVFLCGSLFDFKLKDNFFDCAISLHTIYHLDKYKQEEAVRKLIQVVKKGKNVIIVYSNQRFLLNFMKPFIHLLIKIKRSLIRAYKGDWWSNNNKIDLYFFAHKIKWWRRFNDVAQIRIIPWRTFSSEDQKILIPNNAIGKKIFDVIYFLEEKFPSILYAFVQYPMIILTKKIKNADVIPDQPGNGRQKQHALRGRALGRRRNLAFYRKRGSGKLPNSKSASKSEAGDS